MIRIFNLENGIRFFFLDCIHYGNAKLTITTTVKVREQGVKGHNSPIFVEKERFEGVTKRRKNVNVLDTV